LLGEGVGNCARRIASGEACPQTPFIVSKGDLGMKCAPNKRRWNFWKPAAACAAFALPLAACGGGGGDSGVSANAQDTIPPAITAVAIGDLQPAHATITWTTNEKADSWVEYGVTLAYGSSTPRDSSLVTGHTQDVPGLSASTTYHYRVTSRDASGNQSTSADQSFTTAAAPMSIAGLHVTGNTIVNGAGQALVLHGVNHSGSEFACIQGRGFFDSPGTDSAESVAAKAAWRGINAVRVPMNEGCWLGINGAPAAYSGAAYRDAIKVYVDRLVQAGLIPILELHWTAPGSAQATGQQPMLNRDHSLTFWTEVASAYKSNSSVIFDPHNEPFPDNNSDSDQAWLCWRDGGTCAGVDFQAAGMQEVVDTIRATGSTNIIMLGGVQYSNSLSQWLAHKPTDPTGNLAASWHVYNFNNCSSAACWDGAPAAVVAQVPLIAGEIGDDTGTHAMTDALMNWMDAKGAGYLAWSWNTWGDNLSLVNNDKNGTPTAWGLDFKNHVQLVGGR
jgi:hypothetical protein